MQESHEKKYTRPEGNVGALAAHLRSLVESVSAPRTWFGRIARACSREHQATEQTILATILAMTAELEHQSTIQQELSNRHAISEGSVRALFASVQAVSVSADETGKEVIRLKTDLGEELLEHARRIFDLRADQTQGLGETRHAIERALEELHHIETRIDEYSAGTDVRFESLLASVESARDENKQESARLNKTEEELARIAEYARTVRAQVTNLADDVARSFEVIQQSSPLLQDHSESSRSSLLPQINARLSAIETSTATLRGALAGLAQKSVHGESELIKRNRQRARFDQFYVAFEHRYRGSVTEIRSRQQKVVPIVERIVALQTISRKDAVVVDLGCGRGEWLDVLRASGFERTVGVDSNPEMVRECRKRSLSVEHSDAIAFLDRQPDRSVVAITGFHIVEHLPFAMLLDMMVEARRVLAKTGVLIFETPNPENALVATRTFHLDPTHRNPIPPQLLAFAMEHVGFTGVQVLRLHPYSAEHLVKGKSGVAARFNEFFFGPQDYAVVGNNP